MPLRNARKSAEGRIVKLCSWHRTRVSKAFVEQLYQRMVRHDAPAPRPGHHAGAHGVPVSVERLRRADWCVRSIPTHGEALRLIRAWHYAGGAPNTSTYRHGLYRSDLLLHGDAHGCALWIPPTKSAAVARVGEKDWGGVLALSRLVIDPELPTNAASFLLGASMRLIDKRRWPFLLTYADTNQGHTGAIYLATNWTCEGPVPAGDVWERHGRLQGRKRGGHTLTVAQMLAAGFTRRPSAPKIRYVVDRRG